MSLPPTKKLISNYAYCIKDKLGEGFSGEVFRGLDQRSGLPVAIKVVSKLGPNSSEKLELAETQIRVLDLLKGSCNILQLKQALQTKNSIYIISEYCSKGNLRAILNQRAYLSEAEAIKYILQVISGYQSIHQRGLLHRDIKPDNILITQQDQVRIGDFGFAISADKCYDVMPENIGTPLFMPYQTLAHSQYSPKSDIWAIGITFLEMITGRPAWKANTQKKLITELENFDIQNIIPKGISEGSQRFLRKTLQKDIDLRMSPEQLFSFSFDKIQDQNNLDKIKMALKKCTSLEVIYERQIIQGNPNKSPLQKLTRAKKGQQKSQKSTQEQSKTDFERISQIQSIQKLDSLKKIGSHKTINSLDQISTNNTSKIKDGLCRKFSEIKNQSLRHDESTECIFNALGKGQTYEKKLTIKMQREALMEIQSQINYFRFAFKLFKKINDILKTNDSNIKKLKQNLLYFVHAKIDAIERLEGSSLSHEAKKGFKETPEFVKVLKLLAQYRVRYSKQEEKSCILTLCDEKCFASSLQKTIKILYQNIANLQHNDQEFLRKKNLVLILSDLVCLNSLHKLDLSHDWALFHSDSNITSALQRPVQSNLSFTRRLWSDLKQEINQKMCI